jgi:hypothetical protein
MQTFITDTPSNDYGVQYLDQKRLVKQLLECRQIMAALAGETKGWVNHPATKMWRGSEVYLYYYARAVKNEMALRGYSYEKNWAELNRLVELFDWDVDEPAWFHDSEYIKVMYTHRGRLFIKNEELYPLWSEQGKHYTDYVCCDRCNYYWPTHVEALTPA